MLRSAASAASWSSRTSSVHDAPVLDKDARDPRVREALRSAELLAVGYVVTRRDGDVAASHEQVQSQG